MKSNTIKEMYREERPYEKCEQYGPENLTDAELLAILLRTGTKGENSLQLATRLLHSEENGTGLLHIHRWTGERLKKIKGIGKVKSIQILCLCELSKRMARASAQERLNFSAPETITGYYMEDMRHRNREVLKLILLNTRSRLIGEKDLSIGTVNMALISPREILVEALLKDAVSIILIHNHPSGDPTPSRNDICVTRRVFEAGRMIGIGLLDHIVIGDNCFVSMREKGFLDKMDSERS